MTSETKAERPEYETIERAGYLTDEMYDFVAKYISGEIKIESPAAAPIRLAKGVRIHVRRLREAGLSEEADRYKEHEKEKKFRMSQSTVYKIQKANALLDESIEKLITVENRVDEVVLGIKVAWLANAAGYVDQEERKRLVNDIFDVNLGVEETVTVRWETERDKIAPLMPSA